jgi:hypothetical protein
MQPRHVCTLKMGYWSLSSGRMDTRFLHHCLYMLPTSQVDGMSSKRTCTSFHSLSWYKLFSDVNTTAKCWCVFPKGTLFECLGEYVGFILLAYQICFSKSGLAALDIYIVCHIPYTCLSAYDRKFFHKTTRMFPLTTSFSLWTPSSYQEIFLMHAIRREIAHCSWTKIVATGSLGRL